MEQEKKTNTEQNNTNSICVGTKMKTEQIMQRDFYGGIIRQQHKTGWLNATDLLRIGNDYRESLGLPKARLQKFLDKKATKEFIEQILEEEKIAKVVKAQRGKQGGSWMHPMLFVDFAMYLNPKFKYEAMAWLTDRLLLNRDVSGESFKEMMSVISREYNYGGRMGLVAPKIAYKIKTFVGVDDWNLASEEQLKKRDEIQKKIIFGAQLKAPIEEVITKALT